MSDPQRPHGLQPSRLFHPWDSPGKNTGVGCHFLLQCMKVKSESEVAQSCPTLRDPMDCSLPGSSAHGVFQARVLEWVAIAFSTYSLWWIAKKCIELFVKRNEIIHIKQLERYLEHCRYKVHCCFPSSNIFCSILSKQDGSCGCRTPLPWSPVQCLL